MRFKILFNNVYRFIEKGNYNDALDLCLNRINDSFDIDEINNFFKNYKKEKEYKVYSVSGSGGSKIGKPNITTILAYHLHNYYNNGEKIIIYKTGSRKNSSLQGSTDFINSNNVDVFLYNDDTIFNLILQCLRFNKDIDGYLMKHYVCSKKVDKKIIFTCKDEDLNMYKDCSCCDEILLISSKINGQFFDEINPQKYYLLYPDGSIICKESHNPYEYIPVTNLTMLNNINKNLLNGIITNFWGMCLKYEMIESISFFENITFSNAKIEVEKYFKNLQYKK